MIGSIACLTSMSRTPLRSEPRSAIKRWGLIGRCRAPRRRYYRIVAALLLGAGGALTGNLGLAAGASGMWLVMTARFCAQRLTRTVHTLSHVAEMIITSALIPPLAGFWRLRGALRFRVWFL